ncbi:hypothetical protein ACFQMH_41400 [Streptomyces viridiviolaceus]|uniref:Uncharacterized protein n=1 Tax=Streptomyces viridiviolaceus TaxID=68282 RepID=A0ABW2EFH3_9ACTN|nr:hypothetical protein [Streptomyces viridiviolaceus]
MIVMPDIVVRTRRRHAMSTTAGHQGGARNSDVFRYLFGEVAEIFAALCWQRASISCTTS